MLFSPDLFVVGGGVSKESDEFLPLLDIDTEIIPAPAAQQGRRRRRRALRPRGRRLSLEVARTPRSTPRR